MTSQPPLPPKARGFYDDMSSEAQARRARKAKSPWRKGPMCAGPNAGKSFKRYQEKAR